MTLFENRLKYPQSSFPAVQNNKRGYDTRNPSGKSQEKYYEYGTAALVKNSQRREQY